MEKKYNSVDLVYVALRFRNEDMRIGCLAEKDGRIFFEYDDDFIKKKIGISPFNLPSEPGLSSFDPFLFSGLPGVFNDSLPDGWGRLLLDRALRTKRLDPSSFSVLDRLAHVGTRGMGALTYIPDHSETYHDRDINLDSLATNAHNVLESTADVFFEELLILNGSSAGARPKAMIGVNKDKSSVIHGVDDLSKEYEHWLVKFTNSIEGNDTGAIEYVYADMAKLAGIEMSETYLFPAKNSAGYFSTKRFDRVDNDRRHLHTACGLLHSDFRTPSLDYQDLIKATELLTKDAREVRKMYRLAVFNVLAHNRDDHAKNFSFLMDEKGQWSLSPAYDLTFSSGPNGEQSMMVMGEGAKPGTKHLLALAKMALIEEKEAKSIIEQVKGALAQWEVLAKNIGVSRPRIKEIKQAMKG